MKQHVERQTVDLSGFPDLVVIMLGMRVNALAGIKTLLGFGPAIDKANRDQPDGLLGHDTFLFSLFPPHVGIRQYWRDFDSLEAWTRGEPHRRWWRTFLRDSGGTQFWHETYCMCGGMEAIYLDVKTQTGFLGFAPVQSARGGMFTSRDRTGRGGSATAPTPVSEDELDAGKQP